MVYGFLIVLSIFIPAAAIGVGFMFAVLYAERFLLSAIIGSYVAGTVAMFVFGFTASAAARHPEWMGGILPDSAGWAAKLQIYAAVVWILPLMLAMGLAVIHGGEERI